MAGQGNVLARFARILEQTGAGDNPLTIEGLERFAQRPEGPFGHPHVLECKRIDQAFPHFGILRNPDSDGFVLALEVDPEGRPWVGGWLPDGGRYRARDWRGHPGVWLDAVVCGPGDAVYLQRTHACQMLGLTCGNAYRRGLKPRFAGFLHGKPVVALEAHSWKEGDPRYSASDKAPFYPEFWWGGKCIATHAESVSVVDEQRVVYLWEEDSRTHIECVRIDETTSGFVQEQRILEHVELPYDRFVFEPSGCLCGLLSVGTGSVQPQTYTVRRVIDYARIASPLPDHTDILDVVRQGGRTSFVTRKPGRPKDEWLRHYLRGWVHMQDGRNAFIGQRQHHKLLCVWTQGVQGPAFDLVSSLFCGPDGDWRYWGYTKDPGGCPALGHLWLMQLPPFNET